jgi:hypothetical protein
MSDGGKGSRPRPYSVTQEEYSKRWDMIFGRDLDEPTEGSIEIAKDGTEKVFSEGYWQDASKTK